jgi:hypothetical protein
MNTLVAPNALNDVIHSAANADFTGYTYTQVYAQVSASPVINGTTVTLPAGMSIPMLIRTISPTGDVFVIGKKNIIVPQYLNG